MLTIISYIFFLANLRILTKAYLKSEHVHSFSKKWSKEMKRIHHSFFFLEQQRFERMQIYHFNLWMTFLCFCWEELFWKEKMEVGRQDDAWRGWWTQIYLFSSLSHPHMRKHTHTHLEKLSSKIWFFISARAGKETSEPKHACVKNREIVSVWV